MNVKNLLLICVLTLGMLCTNQAFAAEADAQAPAVAQDGHTVSGKVVDSYSGEAIIGAYVTEQGNANNVVMTDTNGEFRITLSSRKGSIEVSYVGYKTSTLDVTGVSDLEVKLESDNQVEEVVVVGAGVQRKVSITGAITSIEGDQLRTSSSSLTTALAGKLAGVIQMNNSGAPGSTSEFYIRGIGTFGGVPLPLFCWTTSRSRRAT